MSVAVVCDFDGTIVTEDFAKDLLKDYCKMVWQATEQDFKDGKISLRDMMEKEVAGLAMSRQELSEYAKKRVKFRPGFWEFYGTALDRGFRFIIVSEGLAEYIKPFFNPEITIYSNECEEANGNLKLKSPHASSVCDKCGTCKKNVVNALKERGYFVIYIGDGVSDFCAAQFADLRLARGQLARHLAMGETEFMHFEDFNDILGAFESGF